MPIGLSEERVITTVQLTISVQGLSVHVSCIQAWVATQNRRHTGSALDRIEVLGLLGFHRTHNRTTEVSIVTLAVTG